MAFDLVVFDLDGTVIDSLADIADSANHVLAARGIKERPRDAFRPLVGEGARRLIEMATPELDAADHDELERAFRLRYSDNLLVETCLYPGVAELLDTLETRLAILTNKPQTMADQIADALLERGRFVDVVGQRPDVPRKPDPTLALAICESAGVEPSRAVLVGDTWVDIETARRAGMTAVGVTWGFRSRDDLLAAGPDYIVDHPAEVLELVTR